MQYIKYNSKKQLQVEGLSVADIVTKYGSPLYIYSQNKIKNNWQLIDEAFGLHPHLVCYAVKANPNIAILQLLATLGSGFDIVSQGELERVLQAGGDPAKVVFSGVGKSITEIRRALEVGIKSFNVESYPELVTINQIAKELNTTAPISLRINPNIDANSHPYICTGLQENKFGIPFEQSEQAILFAKEAKHLELVGLGSHIGSQITEAEPFADAAKAIAKLLDKVISLNINIKHIDLGGGLGVQYIDETVISAQEYVDSQLDAFKKYSNLEIIVEPGRSIVANAGILIAEILYIKNNPEHNFAIINAGMSDLIRPALYEAEMQITEVDQNLDRQKGYYDVVGPICESADFLGKNRLLAVNTGDLIAIHGAGAYGASMSSTYNSRLLTPEVIVNGEDAKIIRKKASYDYLWQLEK